MRFKNKHNHMIDFLFPVALFFVFTLSALTIILLAAGIYRSSIEESALNDTARTSLSYISEKVHQHDSSDSVSLGTFDGCDALILKQTNSGDTYYTYIYCYDNELKELFAKDGAVADASGGKTILKVKDFSMKQVTGQRFEFHCTDTGGRTATLTVALKSSQNN